MNKLTFLLGAGLALFLAGCTDDEFGNEGIRPVKGDEIPFAANSGSFDTGEKNRVLFMDWEEERILKIILI